MRTKRLVCPSCKITKQSVQGGSSSNGKNDNKELNYQLNCNIMTGSFVDRVS